MLLVVASIDEAIDARRKNRVPKRHPEGPSHAEEQRGPGSLASSGFVVESEAGTSFTGSYGDQTPAGEPPSLAAHEGPDDEVRIRMLDHIVFRVNFGMQLTYTPSAIRVAIMMNTRSPRLAENSETLLVPLMVITTMVNIIRRTVEIPGVVRSTTKERKSIMIHQRKAT